MNEPITRTAVVYEYAPDSEQRHAEHGQEHVAFLQRLNDDGLLDLSGRIDMDSPARRAAGDRRERRARAGRAGRGPVLGLRCRRRAPHLAVDCRPRR